MRSACITFGPRNSIGEILILLSCFFTFAALAQPKLNPYLTISVRNIFNLKDPASLKPAKPPPPPRPTPKLVLNGVADFSHLKWAFVTRTDPGRPPKSYTLEPGETEGGLQLIELNAKTATATVRVDGFDTAVLELGPPTNSTPAKPPARPQVTNVRPRFIPMRR